MSAHESSRTRASPSRFGRRAAALVFLGFLVLGMLYTAPLVTRLGDALPYAAVPPAGREQVWRVQGDYLQLYYYLWLVRDRLLAGASLLGDPYQFAVDGPRPNLPSTFLPFSLIFLPLSALGPLVAYNLLVLVSFPLAGLSAALLAHRLGASRLAALVAGVVFACGPYRVGTLLGGHPAGFAYYLAPLALWGLEGALAGSVAGGAWAGAALLAMALVEPHFYLFAALGLPLYLAARVGLAGWTRDMLRPGPVAWAVALAVAAAPALGALAVLERQGWKPSPLGRASVALVLGVGALALWQSAAGWLVAAGLIADGRTAARRSLVTLLPWLAAVAARGEAGRAIPLVALALPAAILGVWLSPAARRLGSLVRPLGLVAVGAGAGAGFLLLLRRLLLEGSIASGGRTLHEVLLFSPAPADLLARVNPSAGRAIYPGLVALALAVLATVHLCRRPAAGAPRVALLLAPALALSILLSLGPRLTALPLFETAFRLVPLWGFIRQPGKLQVVTALALAVLAALGAAALADRRRTGAWRTGLPLVLAAAVALEYHPGGPVGLSALPAGGPAYEAIRAEGPRALYVPFWPGDSSYSALYLQATTLTRVPMLNGYSAFVDRRYVSDVYRPLEAVNVGHLGSVEHAMLRRLGVRQVVLDREAFPLRVSPFGAAHAVTALRASPFLDLVRAPADGGPHWVFRVREAPAERAPTRPRSPMGAYWEAESLRRETGRILADPDTSNGQVVAVEAGRDRPGFLAFGPYRLLPAGPFHATFVVRGAGSGLDLQVTTGGGTRVLGAHQVRLGGEPGVQWVTVAFTADAPSVVETRARWNGAGAAALDAVTVSFADVPDPAREMEVEHLAHELAEFADPGASGGVAARATPDRTPRERLWQGPLRGYPPGDYRLWVRLKLDRTSAAPLAWCGAQAASLGGTLGGRELLGAEVPEAGRWVELAVPFRLARRTVIELPCLYRGLAGVWFDRLRVEGPL